ncbi:hypothetical protein AUEXF2481DRAFT_530775 [Aureobasidium subglaciale EXF-2481]|uniref:Uncharacterized protein n=1 Tax=Aureobasidium subglaciale (strain EXF-2481) TaxID=1043005 RepID=A0A074YV54_AURSE|nr:uncharacterized protein AUEXF2481DRAFT_530775 [Aureobasidium subglaciale EXF-2481]KEQ90746.1 hypothetical protein AUEXF2481DRAFT_530775 [Aureobasidium subglaciale EXF-2481]
MCCNVKLRCWLLYWSLVVFLSNCRVVILRIYFPTGADTDTCTVFSHLQEYILPSIIASFCLLTKPEQRCPRGCLPKTFPRHTSEIGFMPRDISCQAGLLW